MLQWLSFTARERRSHQRCRQPIEIIRRAGLAASTTATVTGQVLGIPGNGKQVRFRVLHVFEFRDGRISRENVWMDGAALAAQLTS